MNDLELDAVGVANVREVVLSAVHVAVEGVEAAAMRRELLAAVAEAARGGL